MTKRIVYKVVHASTEENQRSNYHYITCLQKETAVMVAKNLRKEKGNDYFIATERHHETKRPEENEWGWNVDWDDYGDNAIDDVENY